MKPAGHLLPPSSAVFTCISSCLSSSLACRQAPALPPLFQLHRHAHSSPSPSPPPPPPASPHPVSTRHYEVVVIDNRLRCITAIDSNRFVKTGQPHRAIWKLVNSISLPSNRLIRRLLTFSTDIAVTQPVMDQLLKEVIEDTEDTPKENKQNQHNGENSVGQFFRHPFSHRQGRLEGMRDKKKLEEWKKRMIAEYRYPLHPMDIPPTLRPVLSSISSTPFHIFSSPHFLCPSSLPLHFSCPPILPQHSTRGAGIYLTFKWKAMEVMGPKSRLEEEAREERKRRGEEKEGIDGEVHVQIRLEVVNGEGGEYEVGRRKVRMPIASDMGSLKKRIVVRLQQFKEGFFENKQQFKLLEEKPGQTETFISVEKAEVSTANEGEADLNSLISARLR